MYWKTTLALLLVTVGIGAYIALYEIKQPTREGQAYLASQILSIPEGSVSRLTLELPDATVTLAREASGWILEPDGVRADPDLADRITRHLIALPAERILTDTAEQPLDPSAFGLNPAVGRLTVLSEGSPTTLLMGEATPVGANRYLQVAGRPEIYVVTPGLFDDMNQSAETFRDPLLIRFNAFDANGLTVTSSDASFALARREGRWDLTQPFEDRAARPEVNALLNRVGNLRVTRFLNDTPPDDPDPAWGFDPPHAEVILLLQGDEPTSMTLRFGSPLPDEPDLVYARRSDEPSLYAVAASDVDALASNPHGLRERTCFAFFTNLVSKVEVAGTDAGWTIERVEGRWLDAGSGEALETERVEARLSALADLRLGGFVEDAPSDLARYGLATAEPTDEGTGLSGPESLTVWTTDRDAPQRLLVGSTIEDSTNRYGFIEGRRAVVRLPETVTSLLSPI